MIPQQTCLLLLNTAVSSGHEAAFYAPQPPKGGGYKFLFWFFVHSFGLFEIIQTSRILFHVYHFTFHGFAKTTGNKASGSAMTALYMPDNC